ncbi:hypothetical protein D3C87_1294670 [compost metagenome]
MSITKAAVTTFSDNCTLAMLSKVSNDLAVTLHDRAHWNFDNKVITRPAAHILLKAILTRLRLKFWLKTEINQCIDILRCLKDHIATFAAVTTVRTTLIDVYLMTERNVSVAAFSGLNEYFCCVDEHNSL